MRTLPETLAELLLLFTTFRNSSNPLEKAAAFERMTQLNLDWYPGTSTLQEFVAAVSIRELKRLCPLYQLNPDQIEAIDITQEVLKRLWMKAHSVSRPLRLRSWLWGCTRHTVQQAIARERRPGKARAPVKKPWPSRRDLQRIEPRLPGRLHKMVRLHLDGCSDEEIRATLKMSEIAFRVYCHRIRTAVDTLKAEKTDWTVPGSTQV